mgnify:CR=1 FL=1
MDGKRLLGTSLICGSFMIAGSAMAVTMEDPWMFCRTIDMASKNVYYSLPFKISNKELSVPSVQYANEFYEHLRKEKRNPSRIYSNCFRTTLIRAELDMDETMQSDKRLYNVVRTSWKK